MHPTPFSFPFLLYYPEGGASSTRNLVPVSCSLPYHNWFIKAVLLRINPLTSCECLLLCFLEQGSSFSIIVLLLGFEEEAGCPTGTSRSVLLFSFLYFLCLCVCVLVGLSSSEPPGEFSEGVWAPQALILDLFGHIPTSPESLGAR